MHSIWNKLFTIATDNVLIFTDYASILKCQRIQLSFCRYVANNIDDLLGVFEIPVPAGAFA